MKTFNPLHLKCWSSISLASCSTIWLAATLPILLMNHSAQAKTQTQNETQEPASGSAEPQQQKPTSLKKESVTFSQHVAPIIFDKCAGCHRPNQVGPFPLLTYQEVSDRAATIQAVIQDNYMPPWKLVNSNLHFANDRRLSKKQKETINQWIEQGKLAGDQKWLPAVPDFPDKWMLGKPDLVIKMTGQFDVPASGPDVYRSFVFPLDLPEDKWIKAVELRPSAKSSVHHALFFVDTSKSARKLDGADGQAGIKGMSFLAFGQDSTAEQNEPERSEPKATNSAVGGGILQRLKAIANSRGANSSNTKAARAEQMDSALARGLGGYVPGAMPAFLPDDLAMHLPAGSDVIMQTHFHPSGKAEQEQAELALYFADKPPSQLLVPIQVPAMFGFGAGISVPAGEKNYVVEDSFQLPVAVEGISVGGHAHYICSQMSLVAQLPDGEQKTLMQIDDWDLDWQDRYYFADRVELPAGTILKTRLVYDNSADNPENPNSPPRAIQWGRQSEDEMGSVTLAVVAKNESDRPELESSLRQHFLKSVVSRFQTGQGMLRLLKQLDANGDGLLQPEEAPPRLSKNFQLFDTDRNNALDETELQRVADVVSKLGIGIGNNR